MGINIYQQLIVIQDNGIGYILYRFLKLYNLLANVRIQFLIGLIYVAI